MSSILNHKDKFVKFYLSYHNVDINKLKGDVLYLGMGTAYCARHQPNLVTSTTFVELDKEVIKASHKNKDWVVHNEDIYRFKTDKKFDYIFINIFYQWTPKEELQELINKYSSNLKTKGEFLYLNKLFN